MPDLVRNEPVLAGTVAMIGSLLGLLIVFGVHVTVAQRGALVGFSATALNLTQLVRSSVTPNHKAGLAHG